MIGWLNSVVAAKLVCTVPAAAVAVGLPCVTPRVQVACARPTPSVGPLVGLMLPSVTLQLIVRLGTTLAKVSRASITSGWASTTPAESL